MKIIAGLGNPGDKYKNTRHNTGFCSLDALADKAGITVETLKFKAQVGSGFFAGEKVLLMKPLTFMNLSGEAIREAVQFYHIEPEDLIVIYDDITLPPGQLRIRKNGSAGGHNGMKSIINCLGSQDFPRVRVGIGDKPARMDLADYVLGHFPDCDKKDMEEGFKAAADACEVILTEGIDRAMNIYNTKKAKA